MAITAAIDLTVKKPDFKSMKSEIKELTIQAQQAVMAFGEFSPEAIRAEQALAQARDRMDDFNDRVAAVNPDKFSQINTVVQGVARGFQAAQGAMALFGNQSEDLEKTLVKLQGAMALAEGLEGLGKIEQQFTAIFNNVISGAKKAFAAIKAGIGSTGIGLLVVALGSIVAYWDDIRLAIFGVSEETKNAKKEQDKYNQSMKELNREREILLRGELAGKQSELNDLQAEQNKLNDRFLQIQKELKIIEQGRMLSGTEADQAREKRLKKELQDNALRLEQLTNGEIKLYKEIKALKDEDEAKDQAKSKADADRAKQKREQRQAELDAVRTLNQELRLLQADEADRELLQLQQWYENARKQYATNQEALLVLQNIYNYKRQELRDKDLKNAEKGIVKQVEQVKFGEQTTQKLQEQTYQRQYSNAEKLTLAIKVNHTEMVNSLINYFNTVSELADAYQKSDEASQRKLFEQQKKLRIASTILSTIEGTQNAFTTAQDSPITAAVPIYPFIQAAAAAAFGLAQIKKIGKTEYTSPNAPSASPMSGGGFPQMSAPTINSSLPQVNGFEQRVFVTEGDISRSQARVGNTKRVSVVR
jgi:hypothetical protein